MIGFPNAGVAQVLNRRKSRRRNPRFNNEYLPIQRSLKQPRHSSGPMKRVASVVISLIDRTTTLRKTLRPPVQNLHATLAAAGIPSGLFSEGAAYLNRQPRHSNPIHIPHTSRTQRRNQNDTFRSYKRQNPRPGPVGRLWDTNQTLNAPKPRNPVEC